MFYIKMRDGRMSAPFDTAADAAAKLHELFSPAEIAAHGLSIVFRKLTVVVDTTPIDINACNVRVTKLPYGKRALPGSNCVAKGKSAGVCSPSLWGW